MGQQLAIQFTDTVPEACRLSDLSNMERFVVAMLTVQPVPALPPARIELIRQRHAVWLSAYARLAEDAALAVDEDGDCDA